MPGLHAAEARRGAAVGDARELPGLALSAVGDRPEAPLRAQSTRRRARPRTPAWFPRRPGRGTSGRAGRPRSPTPPPRRTGSAAGGSRSTRTCWCRCRSRCRCPPAAPRACRHSRGRGSRWSFARSAGGRTPPRACSPPTASRPIAAALSREERKPRSTPSRTIGSDLSGHPLVVPPVGPQRTRQRCVGGHRHLVRAVSQGADAVGGHEAGAGVRRLSAEHAIELHARAPPIRGAGDPAAPRRAPASSRPPGRAVRRAAPPPRAATRRALPGRSSSSTCSQPAWAT